MNRTAFSAMNRCRRRDHGDAAGGKRKEGSAWASLFDALVYFVILVVLLFFLVSHILS